MTPAQHARAKEVFLAASACAPADRAALLAALCADDAVVRAEVERLLEFHCSAATLGSGGPVPAVESEAQTIEVAVATETPSLAEVEAPACSLGQILLERYRITALLGRGGMGEVYRADDLTLGVPVALKFLPRALAHDPARRASLQAEVRLAREITHPRVCRVHDLGEADGVPFLSMECIEGEDLRALLRRIGRFSRDKALELAQQICAGLAAAHARGVLHRDLKPANVMLDRRGQVKLTDFGLAVAAGRVAGRAARAGTPAYMSPEQIRGVEATAASDIYALGLVLYEVFTGRPAFEARSAEEFAELHLHAAPVPPSARVADVDPAVDAVISRCLEKSPLDRPESVVAVALALAGGDPLGAALAAGETPSPEMVVAATGTAQTISRPLLRLVFPATLALLVAYLLSGGARHPLRGLVGTKPPQVLAARAEEWALPLTAAPGGGRAYGFCARETAEELIARTFAPDAVPGKLDSEAEIFFWHRAAPEPLAPRDAANLLLSDARVTLFDPPPQDPAMVTVMGDVAGRLLYFAAGSSRGGTGPRDAAPYTWSAAMAAAGLDPERCAEAASRASAWPPGAVARTWSCSAPGSGDDTVHVVGTEAAGAPLQFAVLRTVTSRAGPFDVDRKMRRLLVSGAPLAVLLVVALAVAPWAWRHQRRGLGDPSGAMRLAAFFFFLRTTALLLSASHVPVLLTELGLLAVAILRGLGEAALVWLLYMGLEPYARRYWPQLVISWSRAIRGAFRDRVVGQHILIGCAVGTAWALIAVVERGLLAVLGWTSRPPLVEARWLEALVGGRAALAVCLSNLGQAVLRSLALAALLVLLRAAVRRPKFATVLFVLIVAPMFTPRGSHLALAWLTVGMGGVALAAWLLTRFGVLALAAASFVTATLTTFPMAARFQAWYADLTLLALALVIGLALYGQITARARPHVGTSR